MRGSIPRRVLSLLVGSLLLVFVVGCGVATGTVSGEVKIKDVAVPSGFIAFHPADSKLKVQTTEIKDGKYTATGVPVGDVTVTVVSVAGAPAAAKTLSGKKTAAPAAAPTVTVPTKYADPKKSGLTLTVKSGNNPYDPPLEADATPPKK